ncbi:MAG TPA: hypothetical protein VNZ06_01330 [Steroidobacteraceae bacterium]|jgi:hypothetical protein|nr:hypothetical protein [Steroidobacteraceae bacterium]
MELRRDQHFYLGEARAALAPAIRWFSRPASPTSAFLVGVVIAGAYVLALCACGALMFQDYPNHLARAVILADLWFHHGEHFGSQFQFQSMLYPYIAADWLLTPLVELLGQQGATFVWTALALLSLPLAMLHYLHATRVRVEARPFVFLVSLYLSTNTFFFLGFVNFSFALALTILVTGLAQQLREHRSPTRYALYTVMIALGFLMHLAFVVFAAVVVGTTGLVRLYRRQSTLIREIWLLLPIVVTLAWYVLSVQIYPATHDTVSARFIWPGIFGKIRQLDWPFQRFDAAIDLGFAVAFAVLCAAITLRRVDRRKLSRRASIEALALIAGCGLLYVLLPSSYGDPTYIDMRALPLVALAGLLWCVYLSLGAPGVSPLTSRAVLTGAGLLLAANLYYLGAELAPQAAWLRQYRSLLTSVPQGSKVLPIYTGTHQLTRWQYLHVASYVVTDRKGIEPYLFSGDQGQPMKYFRYRNHPYAPHNTWYSYTPQSGVPAVVDWPRIACSYDYLLVMKPFNLARIELSNTTIAENSSAALLTADTRGCPTR